MKRLPLLMLLMACAAKVPPVPGAVPSSDGAVVATVNEQAITEEMVVALLGDMPEEQLASMQATGQYAELIRQIQVADALYQRAIAEGLHEAPDVQLALAMSARSTLASEYAERHAASAVTDEAVQAFYEANAERYANPEVRASHILTSDAETMAKVVAELEAGADFATLAGTWSEDPGSGSQGGDLGWFQRGRMVPEFEEVVFSTEEGAISEPFETQFGQHIVLVTGKRDAIPLEDVRADIVKELEDQAVSELIADVQATLGQ